MVLNLNESIHLNILVLLSSLIYHSLLTSNLSALKLIKPLGSSTVTSNHASPHTLLSMYHSLVIPYFSYCSSVWDPPVSSTNSEILEKTQHFALIMCSHINGIMITHPFSQRLNFQPSQLVALLPNYVFSIKSLTTSFPGSPTLILTKKYSFAYGYRKLKQ